MAEHACKIANSILRQALVLAVNLIASVGQHLLAQLAANLMFYQSHTVQTDDMVEQPLENQRIAQSLAALRGSIEWSVCRHWVTVILLYATIAYALDSSIPGIEVIPP